MLREKINDAMKGAMKSQEKLKLSTLRLVNAAIKNADIEARTGGKGPLADDDLLGLLQKMIKQRQESVELYQKGGRADLVKQEQEEIAIISGYLPKQMSDDEMKDELERLRSENAALKQRASSAVRMKVSEKGAVSVYGMGRFPVTLYKEQWLKLLDMSSEIRAFIAENEARLKAKD